MAYIKGVIDTHGNFIPVIRRAVVLVMPKTPRRAESAAIGKCQVIKFCPAKKGRAFALDASTAGTLGVLQTGSRDALRGERAADGISKIEKDLI